MDRLALSLALAVSAGSSGPAAPPASASTPATPVRPPGAAAPASPAASTSARCLDLRGAPRRHLQRGPDGALWLELWTRRPEPRGDLARVDPTTGSEGHVLSDILAAHVHGPHLIAVRALGDDRSVLHGRRTLSRADLDGSGERPLLPPEHALASYALARDAVLYTTQDGALYRRSLSDDHRELLARDTTSVHAAWPDGSALVTLADSPALTVRTPSGAPRPLDLAGPVTSTSEHVLIDSPTGAWSIRDDLVHLPSLHPLPGGALVRAHDGVQHLHLGDGRTTAITGAAIAEALPVPEGIWSLVRHDTDGDGLASALADEADLCLLPHASRTHLPARDRPRRLAADFTALAAGDLSAATAAIEHGVLVLRTAAPGPTSVAALHARAAAVHRAAAELAGGPDLDLRLEWAANRRHASVSWDSRVARPAILAGGHGHASALDPAGRADLDDYLRTLDRAAALGFAPAAGPSHTAPRLAAPGFADLSPRERAARATALWDLLAAHADRHHHGRLAPVHLAGTAHTIRRGRLE